MNLLTITDLQQLADRSLGVDVPVPAAYTNAGAQYYPFLFLLAQALAPALIVELGTGLGGRSTVHFAVGAPQAWVIGIDLNPPAALPYKNIELWQGDTRFVSQRVVDIGLPIDLLFIDSTHETEHALLEVRLYWPLLAHGGVLLADDINMMAGFWETIPEPKFYHADLHSTCGFGVAIKL